MWIDGGGGVGHRSWGCEEKKRNLTYAGEVVVTWRARTNGDVLSKLRVSNKEN